MPPVPPRFPPLSSLPFANSALMHDTARMWVVVGMGRESGSMSMSARVQAWCWPERTYPALLWGYVVPVCPALGVTASAGVGMQAHWHPVSSGGIHACARHSNACAVGGGAPLWSMGTVDGGVMAWGSVGSTSGGATPSVHMHSRGPTAGGWVAVVVYGSATLSMLGPSCEQMAGGRARLGAAGDAASVAVSRVGPLLMAGVCGRSGISEGVHGTVDVGCGVMTCAVHPGHLPGTQSAWCSVMPVGDTCGVSHHLSAWRVAGLQQRWALSLGEVSTVGYWLSGRLTCGGGSGIAGIHGRVLIVAHSFGAACLNANISFPLLFDPDVLFHYPYLEL
ncbi:hypothetical protein K439DRAFT_1617852 [Ramaria rubella]|nr:hypothetical protein K439DRAFT_1617852 [Ramaria rubella]